MSFGGFNTITSDTGITNYFSKIKIVKNTTTDEYAIVVNPVTNDPTTRTNYPAKNIYVLDGQLNKISDLIHNNSSSSTYDLLSHSFDCVDNNLIIVGSPGITANSWEIGSAIFYFGKIDIFINNNNKYNRVNNFDISFKKIVYTADPFYPTPWSTFGSLYGSDVCITSDKKMIAVAGCIDTPIDINNTPFYSKYWSGSYASYYALHMNNTLTTSRVALINFDQLTNTPVSVFKIIKSRNLSFAKRIFIDNNYNLFVYDNNVNYKPIIYYFTYESLQGIYNTDINYPKIIDITTTLGKLAITQTISGEAYLSSTQTPLNDFAVARNGQRMLFAYESLKRVDQYDLSNGKFVFIRSINSADTNNIGFGSAVQISDDARYALIGIKNGWSSSNPGRLYVYDLSSNPPTPIEVPRNSSNNYSDRLANEYVGQKNLISLTSEKNPRIAYWLQTNNIKATTILFNTPPAVRNGFNISLNKVGDNGFFNNMQGFQLDISSLITPYILSGHISDADDNKKLGLAITGITTQNNYILNSANQGISLNVSNVSAYLIPLTEKLFINTTRITNTTPFYGKITCKVWDRVIGTPYTQIDTSYTPIGSFSQSSFDISFIITPNINTSTFTSQIISCNLYRGLETVNNNGNTVLDILSRLSIRNPYNIPLSNLGIYILRINTQNVGIFEYKKENDNSWNALNLQQHANANDRIRFVPYSKALLTVDGQHPNIEFYIWDKDNITTDASIINTNTFVPLSPGGLNYAYSTYSCQANFGIQTQPTFGISPIIKLNNPIITGKNILLNWLSNGSYTYNINNNDSIIVSDILDNSGQFTGSYGTTNNMYISANNNGSNIYSNIVTATIPNTLLINTTILSQHIYPNIPFTVTNLSNELSGAIINILQNNNSIYQTNISKTLIRGLNTQFNISGIKLDYETLYNINLIQQYIDNTQTVTSTILQTTAPSPTLSTSNLTYKSVRFNWSLSGVATSDVSSYIIYINNNLIYTAAAIDTSYNIISGISPLTTYEGKVSVQFKNGVIKSTSISFTTPTPPAPTITTIEEVTLFDNKINWTLDTAILSDVSYLELYVNTINTATINKSDISYSYNNISGLIISKTNTNTVYTSYMNSSFIFYLKAIYNNGYIAIGSAKSLTIPIITSGKNSQYQITFYTDIQIPNIQQIIIQYEAFTTTPSTLTLNSSYSAANAINIYYYAGLSYQSGYFTFVKKIVKSDRVIFILKSNRPATVNDYTPFGYGIAYEFNSDGSLKMSNGNYVSYKYSFNNSYANNSAGYLSYDFKYNTNIFNTSLYTGGTVTKVDNISMQYRTNVTF
jgi:hypothetical protein